MDCFCRVGGPIFFANVDKFVDQLYDDVPRPSDIVESLVICLDVSDYSQELDDDSRKLTSPDDLEMKRLHSPNATAGFKFTDCGDAQGTTNNRAHEAADPNDNTKEDGVQQQNFDSGGVRVIVLDCSRVTFVDAMAAAALKKVNAAYRSVGVQLVLSGCDAKMTAVMTAAGLFDGGERQVKIYPTVHDAVLAVG